MSNLWFLLLGVGAGGFIGLLLNQVISKSRHSPDSKITDKTIEDLQREIEYQERQIGQRKSKAATLNSEGEDVVIRGVSNTHPPPPPLPPKR